MGRSQESFHKKEVQKRKEKKRKDKAKKMAERKESGKSSMDDMIAYVDENGMIVDSPPDVTQKKKTDIEDIEISIPRKEHSEEDRRKVGRLNFMNETKGFGFITESGTGQSVFVHVNDFQDDIRQGDTVSFEIGKGQKGPAAFNVRKQ